MADRVDEYIRQARTGTEIPGEHGYLVRVTWYRSYVTSNGKRAIRVRFTSYNGATWTVDYWRHVTWFNERLRKLILVSALDENTWFWLLPVQKFGRNDKPFWDYGFKTSTT